MVETSRRQRSLELSELLGPIIVRPPKNSINVQVKISIGELGILYDSIRNSLIF
jgi:hypothetical protein